VIGCDQFSLFDSKWVLFDHPFMMTMPAQRIALMTFAKAGFSEGDDVSH